jgi:hypothetical protein
MKKVAMLICRTIPRGLGFGGSLPTLGPLESTVDFGLRAVLRDANIKSMLQFWYHLIDIHLVVFHV